ncbi:MAG: hypothetical protein GF317_06875 [Candidatus Lokiarchaeota archaeon]|nr:hypothetical protein [Candidatus Lokiarchaeota archaeon]MBD3199433.1 hypothetical protein [Candidatus Lokiarchaeota archaeon]
MTYRRDYGKLRLWRSCKTPFRCCGRGSKNPAPLGAGSSKVQSTIRRYSNYNQCLQSRNDKYKLTTPFIWS